MSLFTRSAATLRPLTAPAARSNSVRTVLRRSFQEIKPAAGRYGLRPTAFRKCYPHVWRHLPAGLQGPADPHDPISKRCLVGAVCASRAVAGGPRTTSTIPLSGMRSLRIGTMSCAPPVPAFGVVPATARFGNPRGDDWGGKWPQQHGKLKRMSEVPADARAGRQTSLRLVFPVLSSRNGGR
jgi:hypothetical protein